MNTLLLNSADFDIFKAINEYGAFAVILGVVLIVIIFLVKNINDSINTFIKQSIKNEETYTEMMKEQNKAILEQFSNTKKEIMDVQRPILNVEDLQTTFNRINHTIKDYCRKCMDEIHAQRLGIYLFHNGTYSFNGIHFFKMSCICERVVIGSGTRERAIEHSSIPLNFFDDMIVGLIDNGYYTIIHPNDPAELEASNLKIFFSSSKIKFVHTVAIYDNDNNIIGFVLVEMMKDYTDELIEEQQPIIEDLISKITPVLLFSEYTNQKTE